MMTDIVTSRPASSLRTDTFNVCMAVSLMGKMDQLINFRCEEEFAHWLAMAACKLDMSKSDFIRETVLRGYAALKEERLASSLAQNNRYQL